MGVGWGEVRGIVGCKISNPKLGNLLFLLKGGELPTQYSGNPHFCVTHIGFWSPDSRSAFPSLKFWIYGMCSPNAQHCRAFLQGRQFMARVQSQNPHSWAKVKAGANTFSVLLDNLCLNNHGMICDLCGHSWRWWTHILDMKKLVRPAPDLTAQHNDYKIGTWAW